MRRIAVIPARGGSKRLPRKNVVAFRGKPMIAWTIEAALAADLFERIVVSTEDAEIAAAARGYPVALRDRPPALATDAARVADVCLDVLDDREAAGAAYDVLCCLLATAPLRDADDIRATVALVERGGFDFALAVTTYDLPPHQALKAVGEAELAPMWPEIVARRGDEVGELVVDNGSTYAVSVPAFRRAPGFYGRPLAGYRMPRARSVDIDLPEDLEMALYFAQRLGR